MQRRAIKKVYGSVADNPFPFASIHLKGQRARRSPPTPNSFSDQGLEAQVGSVGVKERIVCNNHKRWIALLVSSFERIEHRIYFTCGSVIARSPESAAVRFRELPRQFLTTIAIATLIVGRRQPLSLMIPWRQIHIVCKLAIASCGRPA